MATDRDEVRTAASALKDAASAFSRALGETMAVAGATAGRELAEELKQATRELNDAVVAIGLDFSGESRRSAKAERTRAELLAAARTVFAQKGYEGASVGDVAAAAGYTKGAVYANFGSKEDLLLELARELTADDAALRDSPASPDLHDVFGTQPGSDEGLTRTLLAIELYLYALRHPESRADLSPLFSAAFDGVATLVHRSRAGEAGEPGAAQEPGTAREPGASGASAPGGTGKPTRDERDLAFALAAVHSLGAIVGPLLPEADDAEATARRLVDRLISDWR